MTINEAAARLAAKGNVSNKHAKKLIEAEARLLQAYSAPLKKMSLDNIATIRYTHDPRTSEIAAINIVPLVMYGLSNEATPEMRVAAQEYLVIVKEAKVTPQDVDGEAYEFIRARASDLFKPIDWRDIESGAESPGVVSHEDALRVAYKSRGARAVLQDVEDAFREYLNGDITEDDFWSIVKYNQDRLDDES